MSEKAGRDRMWRVWPWIGVQAFVMGVLPIILQDFILRNGREGRMQLHFSCCIWLLIYLLVSPHIVNLLKSSKSKCFVYFVAEVFIVLFSIMPGTQQTCNKCLNEQMKTLY